MYLLIRYPRWAISELGNRLDELNDGLMQCTVELRSSHRWPAVITPVFIAKPMYIYILFTRFVWRFNILVVISKHSSEINEIVARAR